MAYNFLNDVYDYWRPSTLAGLSVTEDDILTPLLQRKLRRVLSNPYSTSRQLRLKTQDSQVSSDKNKFQVHLDVHHFSPNEINVKATGEDMITVEGKHEDKEDEHGWISRHFVRKYKVPKGHDLSKCMSKLSSDGVLTITVPKVAPKDKQQIEIPITFTNQPSSIAHKSTHEDVKENGSGDGCKKCTNK